MQISMCCSKKQYAALILCIAFTSGLDLELDDLRVDEFQLYEKKPVSPRQCETVVTKVKASGVYTEESISVICTKELKTSGCGFFAEALSLASSHSDYKGQTFCKTMEDAQFCSQIMDKLLESRPVSDMAFGECERSIPKKTEEYCRKIQSMLALSVKQEDLDTMRACYMMEAYTNSSVKDQPKMLKPAGQIEGVGKGKGNMTIIGKKDITSKAIPLDSFGKGKAVKGFPTAGEIAAQRAKAAESIGKGKGNTTKPKKATLAEPKASPAGKDAGDASATKPAPAEPKAILAEPKAAPLETSDEAQGEDGPEDIITEPVASTQDSAPTTGPTVNPTSALKEGAPVIAAPVSDTQAPSKTLGPTGLTNLGPNAGVMALKASAVQPKPAAQTIYVISMPAAAPNASAAATATQIQHAVAQVMAATQSGMKIPVAQVATTVATGLGPLALAKKQVAAAATVVLKPAAKSIETVKAMALPLKSGAAGKTTAKAVPKLLKAENVMYATALKQLSTVSVHKVATAKSAASGVAFAKNKALKDNKKSVAGNIMGLFVDNSVAEHPEVKKKAMTKPAKAGLVESAVQVEKKKDYGGFLSGFVN